MIARAGRMLASKMFSADAIGLILLAVALQALSYGISASLRNTNTQYFFWICLVAASISFGVSKSKLKWYQAAAGIVALGFIGIFVLGARLATPLLDLGNAVLDVTSKFVLEFFSQVVPAIKNHIAIAIPVVDANGISDIWTVITETSSALAGRLQSWLIGFIGRKPGDDALIRNMIWAWIMWFFSAWAGWFAGRRNAVTALMPAILLLAAVTSYSEYKIGSLWWMVATLLLLMGVWNYKNLSRQWQKKGIDYSDSVRSDIAQNVLAFTLAIGFIAYITPSVSWQDIRDNMRERNQNETASQLGIKEHTIPVKPISTQKPSMPQDHLLSGGWARSKDIVMIIKTGELPPVVGPALVESAPRYYWRSVVYDKYVSAGWVTSFTYPQTYASNTPIIPGLLNGYKPVHMKVQMMKPEGKLFWSGILFSADIPFTATWRVKPQSDLFADQSALFQADMFAATTNATSYEAESYVPAATIQQLRSAPTDYPEDITTRYLVLPNTVPDRVQQLGETITTGITSPYDKAKAIESYLRTYPYDLNISALPEGQDVADYFLFDLKRGYCDYYATAMVVLARVNGLPARFVSGYASGEYNPNNAEYIVRDLNAHSWVEVYFPGIGWVEFEPTASQPEIKRQETDTVIHADQKNDTTASNLLMRFRVGKLSSWVLPILCAFLLVIIYFTVVERWWYLRLAPSTAIERIYQRLYRAGRPLAGERGHAETAYEFMLKLNNRINEVSAVSNWKRVYVTVQRDVRLLTNTYQASLFKDYQTNKNDVKLALHTWNHLRWRLIVARLGLYTKNKFTKNTKS